MLPVETLATGGRSVTAMRRLEGYSRVTRTAATRGRAATRPRMAARTRPGRGLPGAGAHRAGRGVLRRGRAEVADQLDLGAEGDAELVAGPAHGPADEDEHVGGGGAVGGDDEVGVDLADPGPAAGLALHAEQLDHPAGRQLGRVGEHAAAVGLVHRLVVAPPAAGPVDLRPGRGPRRG